MADDDSFYSCQKCGRRCPAEFNFCPNCGTGTNIPVTGNNDSEKQTTLLPAINSGKGQKKKKSHRIAIFIAILFLLFICSQSRNHQATPSKSNSSGSIEIVQNSEWDGSVAQVKKYLEDNLKDPESLKIAEWSKIQKLQNGTYMVRCKYRAKNSFGAYVLNNQVFFLDNTGKVVLCQDYK